jgi:hypothetical protein
MKGERIRQEAGRKKWDDKSIGSIAEISIDENKT